ncbi:MAG: hypothetical protein E7643_03720 [Ruminococcaceae bacterium]|nr:hypothetical protein [Oscillospiraceae bacterium]
MKKRLTCLFLCLVMMLSVFLASCSEETDEDVQNAIEEMAAKNTVHLTMWIVSEEKVSKDVADEVTRELSALTEAKHKARLTIKYLTEGEYYKELNKSMDAYSKYVQENKMNQAPVTDAESEEETTQSAPQTVVGEDGLLKDKYPDLLPNQVDIVYIGDVKGTTGEAMFNELVSKGALAKLDDSIASNAKTLREYLSPTLLSAVQKNGATYAIPNNNVIGEYTYMLMNKELTDVIFSGYVLDGSIKNLYNEHLYSYLDQIRSMTDSSVLPIDATYEECLELLAHYWSIDPDTYKVDGTDFSVFGTLYEDLSKLSRGSTSLDVDSLFANPDFVSSYLKLNSYRLNEEGRDFFRSEKNEKTVYDKTAIKFLKGDLTILTEVIDENTGESALYYDDKDGTRYYAIPVKYPSATSEDIYSNMFGVCSDSVDVSRCMDIITYINTDVEARNILQYGVLDEHYDLKEREVENLEAGEKSYFVQRKIDKEGKLLYNMDIYATGNAFLAYMPAEMNANVWESGKKQNRSSLVDPLLGFDLSSYAASAAKIGVDLVLPSDAYAEKTSYDLSCTTGYSKDVLSQNETLKKWIAECDKKEKGVFAYKTFTENKSAQKMTAVIYVYNTLGAAYDSFDAENGVSVPAFEVIATPEQTQNTDKDGKLVYNEVGMDLCFKYGAMKNSGYTLSIVNYTGTSSANYKNTLSASVGGSAKTVSESTLNYIVAFDAMDTTYYDIEVYGDLYVDHFKTNSYIYDTVSEWIEDGGNKQKVLRWVDKSGKTDQYTFLIYFGDITTATKLDVNVFGGAKTPVIDLRYVAEGFAKEVKDGKESMKPVADFTEMVIEGQQAGGVYKGAAQYLLYYVTAEVEKGVTLSLNSTHETLGSMRSGEAGKIEALSFEQTDVKDLSTKMDVYGELDTELVGYMKELNASLVALLDACTTYEELEAVVGDFSKILDPEKAPVLSDIKTDAVKALFADDASLALLHEKVVHITSYENPANAGSDDDAEEEGTEGDEGAADGGESDAPAASASDIYYYSPFGIYYQWMKEFSYLPE